MSAEVLREAARLMRGRSRFAASTEVADWLDHEAERFEKYGKDIETTACWWEEGPPNSGGWTGLGYTVATGPAWRKLLRVEVIPATPDKRALAVARAYLGGDQ